MTKLAEIIEAAIKAHAADWADAILARTAAPIAGQMGEKP